MNVAVIGGGAAGFFSAISVKEKHPDSEVIIFEKSQQTLAKVKVSGGGRCNVTNGCTSISELCKAYPRGEKFLKKPFHIFNNQHTMDWFKSKGVALKVEEDNRVFPVSDNSQTIVDCLMNEVKKLEIAIELSIGITEIKKVQGALELSFDRDRKAKLFDKVIVATGGSPKRKGLDWLERLGHKIATPVPSLFTFNIPNDPITKLMGVAVENALGKIQGTKLKSSGPLLITHWGMSGPAILKLSSFGARDLSDIDYQFRAQVNWVHETNNDKVLELLKEIGQNHGKKLITNNRPFGLPERLWIALLEKSDIPLNKIWGELGKKSLNKLINALTNDIYDVKGKTTFKEEFVTCGGVSLESIDSSSMQSKVCDNLYFSGEIMDIDAITGGYNFQAAWTTAFIAGSLS